ncbi:MAG TPA: M23 family metallopeptidase [Armatimonadota bacterium]|nr:M23 family metallopeptidase [Armatimonadota bacterium]HOS42934.1 M23 family metallopeptidase [Armatimonadota bacterium]
MSLLSLLAAAGWLLVAGGARHAARAVDDVLTVTPATARVPQGGAALLAIRAPRATAVRVRLGETVHPADARGDDRWEAVIGVWMETKPGPLALTVEADLDDRTLTAPVALTVTQRAFPIQRLRMAREQAAKYTAPSVQEEYRLIGAALRRFTAGRAWQGSFQRPAAGRIATRYGTQRYRNGEKVGIHKGIDIAAPRGAPVYAAHAGVVTLRRDFGLHGRTLVIDHGGGVAGLYLHLNDFGVSEGQTVKRGQLIARVGSTGAATGPHLHYALYAHGTAIDPLLMETMPAGW